MEYELKNRELSVEYILNDATALQLSEFDNWIDHVSVREAHVVNQRSTAAQPNSGILKYLIRDSTSGKKYSVFAIFVSNWIHAWNNIVVEQGDSFGENNALYRSCCEFYFDVRVVAIISMLTLYIAALCVAEVVIDKHNFGVYIGPAVSNIVFIIAYIWGASIYKGELMQSSLTGDDTRMAREKAFIETSDNCSYDVLKGNIRIGSAVYAKYYEDGPWISGVVVGSNIQEENGNKLVYDVMYDRDGSIETGVQPNYIYVKPHSSTSKRQLLRNMWKELFRTMYRLIYPSHIDYVRSRDSESSSVLEPLNLTTNEDWEEDIMRYCVKEQAPISCGYYETLICVLKYSKTNGRHKGTAGYRVKQSRLNRLTTIFLVLMMLCSPLINAALWYIIYRDRSSQPFLNASCNTDVCRATFLFFVASGGYSLSCIQQILLYNAVFMVFIGLLYGCDSVHYLSKNWQLRYRGLRRIGRVIRSSNAIDLDINSESGAERLDVQECLTVMPTDNLSMDQHKQLQKTLLLVPFIQRDAFERYLLIHHFVRMISTQWSAFLFSTLFLSLLSTGFTYYLLITSKQIQWGFILAIIVETLFFVYPVACLGYANKHVDELLNNFKMTSPDDYAVLGSRDKWKKFTEDAPLYWTIMGIPITRSVLTAYLSAAGTVAPVVIGILTVFSDAIVGK